MNRDMYISNRGGKRINPAEEFNLPIAASGQTKDLTGANTDYTLTVVAGERYWVSLVGTGTAFLGVAAVGTGSGITAANALWVIGPNGRIGIEIPEDITSLHMAGNNAGDDIYLSRADT